MRSIDPGFDTHNVPDALQMSLTGDQYQKTAGLARLVDASIERIRALPGVESAAAGCCTPIGSGAPNAPFVIANRPLTGTFHARANMPTISHDFFDVFRIPILRGRKFTDRDAAGAPLVAIINQAMARQFWPNDDAIGARVSLGSKTATESSATNPETLEIVGVAGDVREAYRSQHTDPEGNTIYTSPSRKPPTPSTSLYRPQSDHLDGSNPGGAPFACVGLQERTDPGKPRLGGSEHSLHG